MKNRRPDKLYGVNVISIDVLMRCLVERIKTKLT